VSHTGEYDKAKVQNKSGKVKGKHPAERKIFVSSFRSRSRPREAAGAGGEIPRIRGRERPRARRRTTGCVTQSPVHRRRAERSGFVSEVSFVNARAGARARVVGELPLGRRARSEYRAESPRSRLCVCARARMWRECAVRPPVCRALWYIRARIYVCTCALTDSDGRAKADDRGERLRLLRQTRCREEREAGETGRSSSDAGGGGGSGSGGSGGNDDDDDDDDDEDDGGSGRARDSLARRGNLPLPCRRQHCTTMRTAAACNGRVRSSRVQPRHGERPRSVRARESGEGDPHPVRRGGPRYSARAISFPRRRALSLRFIHSAREMVQRGEKRVMK